MGNDYPGSLAWDVDNISLVRRVFLVKSIPTSAYTQLNSCISVSQSVSNTFKKSGNALFFSRFEFMAGSVVASA